MKSEIQVGGIRPLHSRDIDEARHSSRLKPVAVRVYELCAAATSTKPEIQVGGMRAMHRRDIDEV